MCLKNHDTSLKGGKLKKNMFCSLVFWGFLLLYFFFNKRMCLVAFCSQLTHSLFIVTMRGQNQFFFLIKVDASHNNISELTVKKNTKISEVK